MELALYHPELGYYSKSARQDDYYTSVDVHPLFGEIFARQIQKQFEDFLKSEPVYRIIELGAGEGKLCRNILNSLKGFAPAVYERCLYVCVERSPARQAACEAIIKEHPGRVQVDSDLSVENFSGIILSNEFFDALPFHRVTLKNGILSEILVGPDFKETVASASKFIFEYFEWLGTLPLEGAVGEAQISAREWMGKIGRGLRRGIVLSVDYGHEARDMFSEIRPEGTALCHFSHATNREFYDRIGDQDLTSHVNFSVLMKEGRKWGLEPQLMSQSKFVLDNGFEQAVVRLEKIADPKERLKLSSAIKSLVHPEGMGGVFKVLLQKKA